MNLCDFEEAILDFSKAIKINPLFVNAYYNRGGAKAKLGDYFGSIEDYSKVIDINPNFAMVFFNRAKSKHNIEDFYGAIEDYTKSIEVNPKLAEAFYNRGIIKINVGQNISGYDDLMVADNLGMDGAAALVSSLIAKDFEQYCENHKIDTNDKLE